MDIQLPDATLEGARAQITTLFPGVYFKPEKSGPEPFIANFQHYLLIARRGVAGINLVWKTDLNNVLGYHPDPFGCADGLAPLDSFFAATTADIQGWLFMVRTRMTKVALGAFAEAANPANVLPVQFDPRKGSDKCLLERNAQVLAHFGLRPETAVPQIVTIMERDYCPQWRRTKQDRWMLTLTSAGKGALAIQKVPIKDGWKWTVRVPMRGNDKIEAKGEIVSEMQSNGWIPPPPTWEDALNLALAHWVRLLIGYTVKMWGKNRKATNRAQAKVVQFGSLLPYGSPKRK